MVNRFVIGLLVVLVILTGGIGFYLNQQVNNLGERLAAYESEQTAHISSITDNLAALKANTESGLSSLDNKVKSSQTDVTAVKSDMSAAKDRITGAEQIVSQVSSNVTTLDKRVAGAEAGISGLSDSVINASDVYEKAVRAVVRITDGRTSYGSGFIYNNSGSVVTNFHVVNGLSPIYVLTYDGKVSRANVVGFCQYSDVAVLKMDINPSINPLLLADSGLIRIGESIIAIGSPISLDNRDTVTMGVISHVNRFVDIEGLNIANLLQFDAAVNPGNSGGPLIDSKGKVIGMVIAMTDPITGSGVNWAIASNKVKRVADSIISKGSFPYPYIGTGIADITPQQVKDKSLETANGALVTSIFSGGPAQTAGLQTGDIIVSMDGVLVKNISDLTSYLGEFKSPGDTAVLEVIRGTGKLKISITVGKRTQ
jgi:S1-C subfamily serine protease